MRVDTDWQTLRACVVGRSYPPDFYQWIDVPHVKRLFEDIATHTENFLVCLTETLQRFGVTVVRPSIPRVVQPNARGDWPIPPLQPRNVMTMIGDVLYYRDPDWTQYYSAVSDVSWHRYPTVKQFLEHAPDWQIQELRQKFDLDLELPRLGWFQEAYEPVLDLVRQCGNSEHNADWVDGGQVCRTQGHLVVGTDETGHGTEPWTRQFGSTVRIVDSRGHVDGVFCILKPGLVVVHDDPTCVIPYHDVFPGWEIIKIPNNNLLQFKTQQASMAEFFQRSQGHWWIPDIENDPEAVDFVQRRFDLWFGNASETILDVNMLVIDDRTVLMCGQNNQLAEELDRHGFTPHVMTVPYPYFWDGGIHCMTAELHRGQ